MSKAERVPPPIPAGPLYSRYTERTGSISSSVEPAPAPCTVRHPDTGQSKNKVFQDNRQQGKATRVDPGIAGHGITGHFSKHTVTLIAAATFKAASVRSRTKVLTNSCPNLVSPFTSKSKQDKRRQILGSDSALQLLNRPDLKSPSPPGTENKLKVPVDIFTTSYTHSKPSKPPSSPHPVVSIRHSLQDIPDAVKKSDKLSLRRTISLTKDNLKLQNASLSQTQMMYRDEQLAQINDYMFIGSIESAFNERRLCRLDIESLVDISNKNEMDIPSSKRLQCPCLCQTDFRHFRSRLIISVADEEQDHIEQYFEEVNRFIEGARRCGKKVLLYSYEGKSRSALFAMQYLMSFEGLLLRQVYSLVKKQRPCVSLNPCFQRALETLEKTLFPDAKPSVNICNEYLNVADPQAIKCAWIDC